MDAPLNLWLKGFGEDANGELYVLASTNLGPSGTTGVVLEIVPEPGSAASLAVAAVLTTLRRKRRMV
jgi:hypothetical protein